MTPTANGSRRILILEDERPLYEILKLMLETRGWQCVPHAANSRSSVASGAAVGPIDAALLDLNAGETNGLTVADEMRRANPSLPIVLMTGNSDADLKSRVAALKHSAMLQKPFSIVTLEAALAAALAK